MGRLPWPVVLTTGCGRFALFPDGRLSRAPADPGMTPDPGYRIPAGPHAWAAVQGGHVVFVQRGVTVWRSVGAAFETYHVDNAAIGRDWVAFTQYGDTGELGRLYFARLDGPERPLALNEAPLIATRWGGFIASRWRDNGVFDIVARRPNGSMLRVVATHVPYGEPGPNGTVLFRRGSTFVRTDGRREAVITRTTGVAPARQVGLQSLADGWLVVLGPDRLRLLTPRGRIAASASVAQIPKGGWGYVGSQLTVQPGTRNVVFTATHWADENAGGGPGWEGVYRLTPGDTHAMLLFGRHMSIAICAHASSMSWRGRWLLYSSCEGRVVAIDMTGRHDPILLSRVARSIPEPEQERAYGLYGARWAWFGPSGPQVINVL